MKKSLPLISGVLLFVIMGLAVQAQNYQPFRKGLIYQYFSRDSLYSMQIDTAKVVGGDSVFVFNATAQKGIIPTVPTACPINNKTYFVQPNNQFGQWLKKLANGDYVFHGSQGQNFLLKTQVPPNSTWTFNNNTGISVTLVSKVPENFGGITENVITYSLSNGSIIKLSENHGIIQAPNFMSLIANSGFKARNLLFYKLPEPNSTSQPLIFRIYDFQPGDKFSYFTNTSSVGFSTVHEWDQYEVLTRRNSIYNDSIYYTWRHSKLARTMFMGITSNVLSAPVIESFTVSVYDFFPGDLLTNGFAENGSSFWNKGYVKTFGAKSVKYNNRERGTFTDLDFNAACSTFNEGLHSIHISEFSIGLGKTAEVTVDAGPTVIRELQAYQKGTETYGVWPNLGQLMVIEEVDSSKPFTIYPNPFATDASIIFNSNLKGKEALITITDSQGKEVYKKRLPAISNQANRLFLPKLAKGLYLLQIIDDNQTFTTKLIKE